MKHYVSFDLGLKKNPYSGLYVAFEGIDGSGKTTQANLLRSYFEKKGKTVVVTSEPRKEKSQIGRLIHKILNEKIKVPAKAMQYLYSADRGDNHENVVISALKKGQVVISHRCFWSAVAYGVFDKSSTFWKKVLDKGESEYTYVNIISIMVAQGILSFYHQFIKPDLTLYLDVSANTALKRISGTKKSFEIYEKKKSLQRVLLGYRWLVQNFSKEIIVLRGERSSQEVAKEAIEKLMVIMDNSLY